MYRQFSHWTKLPYSENIEEDIAYWVDEIIDEHRHPEKYNLEGLYHENEYFAELQNISTIISPDGKWVHLFAMIGVPTC